MIKHALRLTLLAALLLVPGCCTTAILGERYQPVGPAVLTANSLLEAEYPGGPPADFSGEQYKTLLMDEHPHMFDVIEPYRVDVKLSSSTFAVWVFDKDRPILCDFASTTGIDYWLYDGKVKPQDVHSPCPAH